MLGALRPKASERCPTHKPPVTGGCYETLRVCCARVSVFVAGVLAIAMAQSAIGHIRGVITDHVGAVLPGVAVSLSGANDQRAKDDHRRERRVPFLAIAPGRYTVHALSWPASTRDRVGGGDRREHCQAGARHLASAAMAEAVTVTGTAPQLDLSVSSSTGNYSRAGGRWRRWPAAARRRSPRRDGRPASTPKPTTASSTTPSRVARTIRSRRSRSTSTPRRTPTSAAS